MTRNFILLLIIGLIAACSYTQKIRDGRTAHDRKQYAVAVKFLKKEYDKADSRIEKGRIAYLLADSYQQLNKSDQSIQWFRTAYDNQYGVDALKNYAYALKKAERYEEARSAFRELGLEIGSPYEYRKEIEACDAALKWLAEERKEYQVKLTDFNTGFADYAPVPFRENQLIITSDRKTSTGEEQYNWTGNDFSDLFVVDLNSNSVSLFDDKINTPENEGTVSFNKDYSEIYFTRCFSQTQDADAYCHIMYSKKSGNSWTIPQPLPFLKDGVNYGHPSISKDGKELYFSCNDPEGWGGYDIYVVKRTGDNWSSPQILSRSVNTERDEKFPYIFQDTLYFSSNAHIGMGGLDIFKSYKLSNGGWSSAQNLKTPINSGGDDFAFVIDENTELTGDLLQKGYFTSTRDDGIGNDDIYLFEKRIPPEPPVEEEVVKEEDYKILLDVYVLEKIYENPSDPNSDILGRKPLEGGKLTVSFGGQTKEIVVDESGLFQMELEEDTDYSFLGEKEEYLKAQNKFSTKGIGRDPNNPVQEFELELVLDKIFFNQEILLENIYYDFDESFIREDAKPTLNELAANLQLNPELRIQLGSHTDCRGPARYNQDLSQRRAQAAVDYLIEKGIDAERLSAKGYGEEELANDCICTRCTEEQHQENRRTTFKILE
ncbi:MAG: OmpA family protein [Saprospiraceae bacterium]|nr:OmpA family protein [Saprospiraceae bacterium]